MDKINNQYRICAVRGCPGKDSEKIRTYGIPTYDKEAWCNNINVDISKLTTYVRVCSRHFEKSCFGKKKLSVGSRPTLNLGHEGLILPNLTKEKTRLKHRVCSIVRCNSTCPPTTLYTFPEEKEQLNQWLLICAIKDSHIGNKRKYVCGKHFDPSMISRKKVLKKGAVPKMEIKNWLHSNANINDSNTLIEPQIQSAIENAYEFLSGDVAIEEGNTLQDIKYFHAPSEEEGVNAIENPLTSKFDDLSDADMTEFESEDELEADLSECLECTNICYSCAKSGKDFENEHARCIELEKQLKDEQAKNEKLRIQNAQLMAQLEAKNLV